MAGAPVETLSRIPLFEELDASELQSIADSMHEANVPAGATVTRTTMRAGDYFGEIALLLGSDRTATVTATTDLRCYALTPWDFRALVRATHAALDESGPHSAVDQGGLRPLQHERAQWARRRADHRGVVVDSVKRRLEAE